nr:MAG TPA: hypothetical protein [Caudoviricetes sp.]DAQ20866.1 MAG TPA: hypothetical protein [Caudoviricetes sp.]
MRFSSALEIKIPNLIYSPFEKIQNTIFFIIKKRIKRRR